MKDSFVLTMSNFFRIIILLMPEQKTYNSLVGIFYSNQIIKHFIMKFNILTVFLIVVFSVSADVIYFNNGDIEEGYAKVNEDRIKILSRDELNKYELSTNLIKAIEYGVWIEDMGKEVQVIAERSANQVANSKNPLNNIPLNKISNIKINGVSFQKALTNIATPKGMSIGLIFVGFIICFIVSLVGNIILLVDAFKNNILWGIFGILFPIVLLIYLFSNYSGNKGKMLFWVYILPFLWLIATILLIGIV